MLSVQEKRSMIDDNHPTLSIVRQCALINLSRASYYRSTSEGIYAESPENLVLMDLINEEYMRHPFYGSRKMRSYLRRLGHDVNRNMRLMGFSFTKARRWQKEQVAQDRSMLVALIGHRSAQSGLVYRYDLR